eukprot:3329684-Pleurochrysis_carterae.AAC.4
MCRRSASTPVTRSNLPRCSHKLLEHSDVANLACVAEARPPCCFAMPTACLPCCFRRSAMRSQFRIRQLRQWQQRYHRGLEPRSCGGGRHAHPHEGHAGHLCVQADLSYI